MKMKIVAWLILLGAIIDVVYAFVSGNQSLIAQVGIPEEYTQIVMLVGLIWNSLSESIIEKIKNFNTGG